MLKNHLPSEILFTIFKKLKHEGGYERSLAQCVLTCRQWKQPAQATLYSKLNIRSTAVLDAMMDTHNDLGKYVQSIDYDLHCSGPSMIKIALLFKNLVNFRCFDRCDDLMEYIMLLLKKGDFPALQTLPLPEFDLKTQEMYEACLKIMKDRITEIILSINGEESVTSHSLRKKLDLFPKLNTNIMDYTEDNRSLVWKDFEAVLVKENIKTLCIQPSDQDDFSFDPPITLHPGVETLVVDCFDSLHNSFMLYVMKMFPHLQKLNLLESNYILTYDEHTMTEKNNLPLFLKYLYSIQTVTDVFLETKVEEIPNHLLSLVKLLDEKQLQDTTFKLGFKGQDSIADGKAVISFTRNDSRNRIFIILQRMDCQFKNLQLMKEVGHYLYRLHLKEVTKDLGKILNMICAYCARLSCLIISHGNDADLYCSPSNEAIAKIRTVKRWEFRDYGITPHLFTLIYKQFPCLEDLVLYGFNNWNIPGSYFPLFAPFMSVDYLRLHLGFYYTRNGRQTDPFPLRKVFIKLETMKEETRYYDLNLESPEYIVENYLFPHINSTEAAYQESIDDDSYMTLCIQYKSVAKFVPTFSPSVSSHLP